MPKTKFMFNAALIPLASGLPAEIAAAIGATIARHAYLDWVLGQVMYSLMEISIRQGRVIMKLPRPRVYVAAVKELYEFHDLQTKYDFEELAQRLEAAERARRELTSSIYMRDTAAKPSRFQLARSPWDPGPGGEEQPEAQVLDGKLLARRRKAVDEAVKCAEKLQGVTNKLLRNLHEGRRSRPALNRRRARR
jgi:hypothetical protein